jgi:hypothetical protein
MTGAARTEPPLIGDASRLPAHQRSEVGCVGESRIVANQKRAAKPLLNV